MGSGARGERVRITMVPASRSPNRFDIGLTAAQISPPQKPVQIAKSTAQNASPRIRAWRKRIVPPSSRTTRSPRANAPTVRPRVSVSMVIR